MIPGVTDNARLVAGFLAGALEVTRNETYRAVEFDPPNAAIVIEHSRNGNRYRVSIEQIEGTE